LRRCCGWIWWIAVSAVCDFFWKVERWKAGVSWN
jgi:hypothetical protein